MQSSVHEECGILPVFQYLIGESQRTHSLVLIVQQLLFDTGFAFFYRFVGPVDSHPIAVRQYDFRGTFDIQHSFAQ